MHTHTYTYAIPGERGQMNVYVMNASDDNLQKDELINMLYKSCLIANTDLSCCWWVVVCCSVLQCLAVCCSVLRCVAVCCNNLACNITHLCVSHGTHINMSHDTRMNEARDVWNCRCDWIMVHLSICHTSNTQIHRIISRVIWCMCVCDMNVCVSHECVCVWHEGCTCGTWFVHIWDLTHSCVWRGSCIYVIWLIHMCDIPHSYVWRDSFMWTTWPNYVCDMPQSCV